MLNPLIGIIAGSTVAPAETNAYASIATTTVGGGGASSITFSSIPATYTHLQIRAIAQNSSSNTYSNMRFNSDTGTNYNNHYLDGDGSSATAGANVSDNKLYFGYITVSTNTNMFGVMVVDILDYANTNKYKTIRLLTGKDMNGSGVVELGSGAWRNTNAITDITIIPSAANFAQYSSFALYGIKGA